MQDEFTAKMHSSLSITNEQEYLTSTFIQGLLAMDTGTPLEKALKMLLVLKNLKSINHMDFVITTLI